MELPAWAIWCRRLALATLGGLIVYVAYFPSDSVQVELGDALWFSAIALIVCTMTMGSEPILRRSLVGRSNRESESVGSLFGNGLLLDLLVWGLAVWMMVAAFATSPPGNLRQATNEAWLWIAGAAVVTSARRLLADRSSAVNVLSLLGAVAAGMAVLALHQEWISLPQTRAEYLADPDSVLRAAGIDAPRGSAQRMVFANRLLDGGATATFALANSLAAFLPVAVLVPVGLLRAEGGTGRRPVGVTVLLVLIAVVAVGALFATRSRSGIGACLLAAVWMWLVSGRGGANRRQALMLAVLSAIAVTALILIGILLFGDDEWLAAAPASIEFRLQYWKSTVALLLDHPLMGAGPGGFQAMYLQYRLPVANETISDPHHFFFETLASGGIVAGVFLVLIACIGFKVARDAAKSNPVAAAVDQSNSSGWAAWIGYGAICSLGLVWMFSLISGQLPDFSGGVIALVAAAGAGWLIRSQAKAVSQLDLRRICLAILFAVMTHLTVSGGWTVPGVAILIWLLAGVICAVQPIVAGSAVKGEALEMSSGGDAERPPLRQAESKASLIAFGLGVVLLACIRFESIVPSQESQLAQLYAEDALRRGLLSRVESDSQRAIDADPWGFEAARWRSEFLRGQIAAGDRDPRVREQWRQAVETCLGRAGANPLVTRAMGEQCLHLYQVYGQAADLEQADRLIARSLQLNPTDESLVAQAAVIAWTRSETTKSQQLAAEARRLSKLGGNIVRDLRLQQIMVVDKIGPVASRRPVYRSVSDEFSQRFGQSGEPDNAAGRSIETES